MGQRDLGMEWLEWVGTSGSSDAQDTYVIW